MVGSYCTIVMLPNGKTCAQFYLTGFILPGPSNEVSFVSEFPVVPAAMKTIEKHENHRVTISLVFSARI